MSATGRENLREHLLEQDVEECATWDVASEDGSLASLPESSGVVHHRASTRPRRGATVSGDLGVWTSLATVLLSLPALVGSWCWPLLLAGFAGVAASEASKQLAHAVSFGVTLAMMTNLAQMVCWKSLRRKGTRLNRHGPTVLVLIAVPLAMLDLTRHVLQDGGVWTDSHMYRPGCPHADARCLNALGAACFLSTYLGFAALIAGVLWSADLVTKVRDGWRRARVAVA